MRNVLLLSLLCFGLAACGIQLPFARGIGEGSAAQDPGAGTPRPTARPGEGAETQDGAGSVGPLGTTLATLGDATEPGVWLATPLVTAPQLGRVTAENGSSVEMTLRPTGGTPGSGSRLSLAAMQALGLALTAIAPVSVEGL